MLRAALNVLGLLLVRHASADGNHAESLFAEGRDELAKGNYAVACDMLRRSDELEPAPGTKLNWGECESRRGRVATAYGLFAAVEQQLESGDVRFPIAKSKREAMEPRLPRLTVTLAPNAPRNTEVRLGERPLAVSAYGVAMVIDPGPIWVIVTAAGYPENRIQVVLEEGKAQVLEVAPLPPLGARGNTTAQAPPLLFVPQRTVPSNTASAASSTQPPSNTKGFVALGLGLSFAALSAVTGALTLRAKSENQAHCDEVTQRCDSDGRAAASRGQVLGTLTTVGLVAGGLGIGLGAYWLITDDGSRRSASLTLRSDGTAAMISLNGKL